MGTCLPIWRQISNSEDGHERSSSNLVFLEHRGDFLYLAQGCFVAAPEGTDAGQPENLARLEKSREWLTGYHAKKGHHNDMVHRDHESKLPSAG